MYCKKIEMDWIKDNNNLIVNIPKVYCILTYHRDDGSIMYKLGIKFPDKEYWNWGGVDDYLGSFNEEIVMTRLMMSVHERNNDPNDGPNLHSLHNILTRFYAQGGRVFSIRGKLVTAYEAILGEVRTSGRYILYSEDDDETNFNQ